MKIESEELKKWVKEKRQILFDLDTDCNVFGTEWAKERLKSLNAILGKIKRMEAKAKKEQSK